MRLRTQPAQKLTLLCLAIQAAAIFLGSAARADLWRIDPSHSDVEFSVRHMMISNVRGHFDKFSGTVTAKGNDPNSVQIEVAIDASSIGTGNARRDADLKGENFLDVAKYHAIGFTSKRVASDGPGKWRLFGELTLHGVTREVVLQVTGPTSAIRDPRGNVRVGASATAQISRKEFGLVYNPTLEAGGVMVGDEVAITIDVEAIRESTDSAPSGM